jgi:hypothetical protein
MPSNRLLGRGYHRNWTTVIGAALVALAVFGGFFLFVFEIVAAKASPYVGLNYLPFSVLLVAGFIAIPIGMLRERRRLRLHAGVERAAELRVDLNNPVHLYALMSLLTGFFVVVLLVGIGSYRSYHASESASFCGEVCHSVMAPEWTTYHRSAHARVACADCHIGAGAGWYVKSKLSGLRQVWATAAGTYPRPIPTPIHDLRPARETCEECHWRRKFIGYKESVRSYFLSDEDSERYNLRMLVKIGGEKTSLLKGSGIHYHMLIANSVQYIALDERRSASSGRMEASPSTRTPITRCRRIGRVSRCAPWTAWTATIGPRTSTRPRRRASTKHSMREGSRASCPT